MLRRLSIDQLQRAGVLIGSAEAVAIAQQLIRSLQSRNYQAQPPFGPPTVENVFLAPDGSVTCASCDSGCAVSEIAILLDALLPPGTHGVPGSLRYTVARALLEVDAPPFDSIDEFSHALSRHERGDAAAVIAGVLSRAIIPAADRRRSDPAITELRRQLRENDARAYEQQLALDALVAMTPPAPPAPRHLALVAGLLVGLTLLGAGELMRMPPSGASLAADRPPAAAASPVRAVQPVDGADHGPSAAVATSGATTAPAAAADKHPTKRTVRATAGDASPDRKSRFRWLRTKIAVRTDPL
jgi:hypothetical protein